MNVNSVINHKTSIFSILIKNMNKIVRMFAIFLSTILNISRYKTHFVYKKHVNGKFNRLPENFAIHFGMQTREIMVYC